jgi:hypothetical protein
MRSILAVLLVIAICATSACSPKPNEDESTRKIGGIDCDAKCQARIEAAGKGEFPRLRTTPRARKNGEIEHDTVQSQSQKKE